MLRAIARRLMYQPSEVYRGARAAANRPVRGSRAGGAVMVMILEWLYAIAQIALWIGCIIAWVRSSRTLGRGTGARRDAVWFVAFRLINL